MKQKTPPEINLREYLERLNTTAEQHPEILNLPVVSFYQLEIDWDQDSYRRSFSKNTYTILGIGRHIPMGKPEIDVKEYLKRLNAAAEQKPEILDLPVKSYVQILNENVDWDLYTYFIPSIEDYLMNHCGACYDYFSSPDFVKNMEERGHEVLKAL